MDEKQAEKLSFDEAKKIVEQRKQENQKRAESASKKRLITSIERKFKTTMIGALASFESHFGELWGHNSSKELTPEQEQYRQVWNAVRTEILNKSNNQARAAIEEIAEYTMTWDKYRVNFIVKSQEPGEKNE